MPSDEQTQFAIVNKDTQQIITFDIKDSNLVGIYAVFTTEKTANKMLYTNDIDELCEVIEVISQINTVDK